MTRQKSSSTTLDKSFKAMANLIKLLPTGTVFLFQFLSPLLTNNGSCATGEKWLTSILLAACGVSCCFSSFTDSYTGSDGKVHYGVATKTGLWPFSDPDAKSKDLSKYKLRLGDFVHASLALLVFAMIGLLDSNVVSCFYASFESKQKAALMALPPVVGGVAGAVFAVFPNSRHGIGYYPATSEADSSS